jgi:hypothetical protein
MAFALPWEGTKLKDQETYYEIQNLLHKVNITTII